MFGFNSEKREAKKAAKELRLATYALVDDYETKKLTEREIREILSNLHKQDEGLFEVIVPFTYHLIVGEHLSGIAVDDALYKRIRKVYMDTSQRQAAAQLIKESGLSSKAKGISVLENRVGEWVCAENFWFTLLSDVATKAGYDFEKMLKERGISRSDSLNHIEIPNAWVTRSGRVIET